MLHVHDNLTTRYLDATAGGRARSNVVRLIISGFVLAALANTALGDPKTKRAKQHIAKAEQAYKAERYEDARKEYAIAYSIDPQSRLLFVLGEINVKLGKCDAAITFLQNYLETNPDESQVAAANEQLAACNAGTPADSAVDQTQVEVDNKPGPAPTSSPAPAATDTERPPGITTPPASAASTTDEGERAWYWEPVGLSLCGGGVLALVGSVVLYEMARGKNDDAIATPSYEDAVGLVDDAHTLRAVSLVTAGVGIAAIAGGGYYFYTRRDADRNARVSAIATKHGAMIGVTGRF